MIELLVTIGIMAVVMSLLVYPISTAYSYIRKAQARSEAQRQGNDLIRRMTKEIAEAAYIFDIPVDGAMITFIPSDLPDTGSNGEVTVVRYGRALNFPWLNNAVAPTYNWQLMQTNDKLIISEDNDVKSMVYSTRRKGFYAPFHSSARHNYPNNPYVIGRYQSPLISWNVALAIAENGQYPMSEIPTGSGTPGDGYNPAIMLRQNRNVFVPVSPLGKQWDVSRFRVTPLKVTSEAMKMAADSRGQKIPTSVSSRYPLWSARNKDFDLPNATWLALNNLADINVFNNAINNAFPLYPRLAAGGGKTNPFGYQILIYEKDMPGGKGLVYGLDTDDTLWARRHFMEWPPINRADWNPALPFWTKEDIQRQRRDGKLVFAQPCTASSLDNLQDLPYTPPGGDARVITSALLPIPAPLAIVDAATGWDDNLTYLAGTLPTKLTVAGVTFKLVDKPWQELDPTKNEYCYQQYRSLDWSVAGWQQDSRRLYFSKVLANGNFDNPLTYLVCDLQPTDRVVVTYSTRAALDIELTLSREDPVGRTPEERRQDFNARRRLTAENAINTVRGSR